MNALAPTVKISMANAALGRQLEGPADAVDIGPLNIGVVPLVRNRKLRTVRPLKDDVFFSLMPNSLSP